MTNRESTIRCKVIPTVEQVTVGSIWNKGDLTVVVMFATQKVPNVEYTVACYDKQGQATSHQWILESFAGMKKIGYLNALKPAEIQKRVLANVERLWVPNRSKNEWFKLVYTPDCERWDMVKVDRYGVPLPSKTTELWYNSDFRGATPVIKEARCAQKDEDSVNLFCVIEEPGAQPTFGLVTREYAVREGCLNDQGFENAYDIPAGFLEVSESIYEYDPKVYGSFEEAKQALLDAGFTDATYKGLESYAKNKDDKNEYDMKKIAEEVFSDVITTTKDDEVDILHDALKEAYDQGFRKGYEEGCIDRPGTETTTTSTTPSAETLNPISSGECAGKPLLVITPDSIWRSGSVMIRVTQVVQDPIYGCDLVEGVRLDQGHQGTPIRWHAAFLCTFTQE